MTPEQPRPPRGPYKTSQRGDDYWVVIDTRSNTLASYPTTKSWAMKHARHLNWVYRQELR